MWFSGGSILCLLCQKTPGWIHSNDSVLSFLVALAFMFLLPADAGYRLFRRPVVAALLTL